jgi:hypothetical protein
MLEQSWIMCTLHQTDNTSSSMAAFFFKDLSPYIISEPYIDPFHAGS